MRYFLVVFICLFSSVSLSSEVQNKVRITNCYTMHSDLSSNPCAEPDFVDLQSAINYAHSVDGLKAASNFTYAHTNHNTQDTPYYYVVVYRNTDDKGLAPGVAIRYTYLIDGIPTCEENPDQDHCSQTCEENPDQEQCLEPDPCEEDPELEECLIDWSRVLSNQRDMLSNQETIKNNQSSFLDISSLAKDNLTANQQGLIDSSNDIIQNQSQVHSKLINSSNSIIQKQLEIKNGQNDIVSDLQQFNLKTAQKQGFISNQIDSVKQSGTDKLGATKAITETLNTNHIGWIDMIDEPSPTTPQQHFDNGVDLLSSVGDDAAAQELSSLDGVINDLTTGPAGGSSSPIKDDAVLPWSAQLNKYIPEANSCDLSLPNPITGGSIPFNLDWSVKLKSILAWIISFYTFLSLFEILFTPVSPKI